MNKKLIKNPFVGDLLRVLIAILLMAAAIADIAISIPGFWSDDVHIGTLSIIAGFVGFAAMGFTASIVVNPLKRIVRHVRRVRKGSR